MRIKKFSKHATLASGFAIACSALILWINTDQESAISVSVSEPKAHQLSHKEPPISAPFLASSITKNTDTSGNTSYPMVTPEKLEKVFSPTLEGTDIDGQVRVGDDGHIVLSLEVKDFFDYFLSTVGEVSSDVALSNLLEVLEQSLPPENVKEAYALLDSYLAFKEDAMSLMAQPMLPREQQTKDYQLQVMEDTLRQIRALRRAHMSPEAVDAFFGLEESYEDYTLATVRVQFSDTLNETEKAELIQYHRSMLPDPIRSTEEQIVKDAQRSSEVHAALANDNEDTIASTLEKHGYDETQKQEILEYKLAQNDFDERYQRYSSEKQTALTGINDMLEQERITQALQEKFFNSEQELTQAKVRDLRS